MFRRFLPTDAGEIRVFRRDETKQEEMRIELDSAKLKFYIGDVRNHDFVCHAMAPKQVPSSEFNPMEGVRRTC